jgi:hypothetical protein
VFLRSGKLQYATHFWIGSESSQDEYGVAAEKSVELDAQLGAAGGNQYREVEGNESPLFLSYFKESGVLYLAGGHASGFNHVEKDAYETALYMVKGKRTPKADVVPLATASLTKGDAFVLDKGLQIFIFFGPTSNVHEKMGATKVASNLREQRGGKPELIYLDDGSQHEDFWGPLGGYVDVSDMQDVLLVLIAKLKAFLISEPSHISSFRYTAPDSA